MATQPRITPSEGTTGDAGCLTYETFFGLHEKPFSLSPNPRFFFRTASHNAAFAELLAGIRRREGILALTGEVGTGKTTLCRTVLESLDRKTFAAYVPDPILTREDLLKTLLVDFGVVSVDEIRAGHLRGASRTELSYPLYEFLQSLQPLQAFAVVIIDEAQNVPPQLLEEIRILSDLEQGQKLLQLLLVGQPELKTRLAGTDMRQLTQRLSVRCELSPLSRPDVGMYIGHRLAIAGSTRVSFSDEAIALVNAVSGGIPRVINLLCDRALFHAARSSVMKVTREHVIASADDLKIPRVRLEAYIMDSAVAQQPEFQSEDAFRRSSPSAETGPGLSPRRGLPPSFQMRHDAHYVDELESIRQAIAAAGSAGDAGNTSPSRRTAADSPAAATPASTPAVAGTPTMSGAGTQSTSSAPVDYSGASEDNARAGGSTLRDSSPLRDLSLSSESNPLRDTSPPRESSFFRDSSLLRDSSPSLDSSQSHEISESHESAPDDHSLLIAKLTSIGIGEPEPASVSEGPEIPPAVSGAFSRLIPLPSAAASPTALSTFEKPSTFAKPPTFEMAGTFEKPGTTEKSRFKRLDPPDIDVTRVPDLSDLFGDEARARQQRQLAIVAAVVVVLTLLTVGVWRWRSAPATSPQSAAQSETASAAATTSAEQSSLSPLVAAPGAAGSSSAASSSPTATPRVPADAPSRFVIQMATFLSQARSKESAQDFQAAGLNASSVVVALRDGSRAYSVIIGPYPDRAQAERALQLAQQVPGYGSGKIVQIGQAADGVDGALDNLNLKPQN